MELIQRKGGSAFFRLRYGTEIPVTSEYVSAGGQEITKITGEFWTSKQRRSNSIHEISYRACYKAELPDFFISEYANSESRIFDPFAGRGTTIIEGVLKGIPGSGIDSNPLSAIIASPRWDIPKMKDIEERLGSIFKRNGRFRADIDLSMFYHPETESEIVQLMEYLSERKDCGKEDRVDNWIRMVATSRLTGHSRGFFSVYTLPPNQAASRQRQEEINRKLGNIPEYRNVAEIIARKSRSLLRDVGNELRLKINRTGRKTEMLTGNSSEASRYIDEESIDLTVTSPPFLNVVQYSKDNWLRCWFNSIDLKDVEKNMFISGSLDEWKTFISSVLREILKVTKKGGVVAFEVGEINVRERRVNLDEVVASMASRVGFRINYVMINMQKFTKTSNIWGIYNQKKGTNTNRIVVMEKP